MKPLSLFAFESYKEYLRARISAEEYHWGLMTKLATAAGCQRPYLSRVLTGEPHLTPAQAFGLTRFWRLSEEEKEYFLGLLEIERAGSAEYREYWKRKTLDAKKRHENLSTLVSRKSAGSSEQDLTYYSAWYWTAIHILVSIPGFRTERSIAEKLNLPLTQVKLILQELESWGAVRKESNQWTFAAKEQHISKNSPLSVFHHMNWRQVAMTDAQRRMPDSIHYTVVQSLSVTDFERIKQMILDLIQKAAEIARPSQEEKLMCFTCDFFEP